MFAVIIVILLKVRNFLEVFKIYIFSLEGQTDRKRVRLYYAQSKIFGLFYFKHRHPSSRDSGSDFRVPEIASVPFLFSLIFFISSLLFLMGVSIS